MSTPFSGAIDLSGLKTSTTITQTPEVTLPPGTFACAVPGGCNLVVRGERAHDDVHDCLATCFPYVELYMETRNAAEEVAEYYHQAVDKYRQMADSREQVLAAAQRLSEEVDKLKADLREARKGTPAAEKYVLAGAEDLAASMKANFGSKPVVLPDLEQIHGSPRPMCHRCGQSNTEPYDYEGQDYVWCGTCQDDAQQTAIYARLTAQGTAAKETAVCEKHLTSCPVADDTVDGPVDCSGNQELSCVICGEGG